MRSEVVTGQCLADTVGCDLEAGGILHGVPRTHFPFPLKPRRGQVRYHLCKTG